MDATEKRRLKKLGKQLAQQRSQEVQELLHEANPAPVGSDEWVANYKIEVERDRQLRKAPPDRMSETEAAAEFVLIPVGPLDGFIGVPTWYVQCSHCHDLLHSVPSLPVACACGAVQLATSPDLPILRARVRQGTEPRVVRPVGRGTQRNSDAGRRPWWRFW